MTAYELRSFPGAAADTTLNGGITSSALSFSVQAGTGAGYPDGTTGPFFLVIDYDNTSTEKVHCTARSGDAFTVDVRGADGTTAFAHGNGAKIRACWTATDAQESNRAAHHTVGQVTTKGDLLAASGSAALVRVPKTSDNTVLTADSTAAGGWSGKSLPALLSGTTVPDLTLPDATLTNPSLSGAVLDATSTVDGITAAQIAADHATTATLGGLGSPLTGHLASALSGGGPGGSAQTVFSIALEIGTWAVNLGVAAATSGTAVAGSGETADLLATATTGITLSGKIRSKAIFWGPGEWRDMVLSFTAVVGTSGTVTVATTALTGNTVIEGGAGAFCGYTALKVA